jgi:hypothetical protein
MLLSYIGVPAYAGANQAPDGIIATERPRRDDLPEADFVAIFGDLEIGAFLDAQCGTHLDWDGDLPLGSHFYYLHKGILTICKIFLSSDRRLTNY